LIWSYQNSAPVLLLSRRCLGDVVVRKENLSDIEPDPVADQITLIFNLECTLSYLTYEVYLKSELSPCPTVISQVFGRCRRPKGKPFWFCRIDPVMYQDSARSPQLTRGIQAMSSERKTFLIL